MISLYFSGSNYPRYFPNRLVSYAYPEQLREWLRIHPDKDGNVMLDSGAHTVWKKGINIEIDKYIVYAHEAINTCKKNNKKIQVVNLDVIPGKKGDNTTKISSGIIERAALKGYENLCIMCENGITPIHVFHQGEDVKWLDKMVERTNYIGISQAKDICRKSKRYWTELVFNYLYNHNIDVKTHAFGVLKEDVLRQFPWTSSDATSPLLLAAYGSIIYPFGRFQNPDYSRKLLHWHVSLKSNSHDLKGMRVKLLANDGYSVNDLQNGEVRIGINVRALLGLEKHINENRLYKPRSPFLHHLHNWNKSPP